jgi:hypothetical protein
MKFPTCTMAGRPGGKSRVAQFLIRLPAGYESGYQLTRFDGQTILTKPGKPSLQIINGKWSPLDVTQK